jgi:hypothetical protein
MSMSGRLRITFAALMEDRVSQAKIMPRCAVQGPGSQGESPTMISRPSRGLPSDPD